MKDNKSKVDEMVDNTLKWLKLNCRVDRKLDVKEVKRKLKEKLEDDLKKNAQHL